MPNNFQQINRLNESLGVEHNVNREQQQLSDDFKILNSSERIDSTNSREISFNLKAVNYDIQQLRAEINDLKHEQVDFEALIHTNNYDSDGPVKGLTKYLADTNSCTIKHDASAYLTGTHGSDNLMLTDSKLHNRLSPVAVSNTVMQDVKLVTLKNESIKLIKDFMKTLLQLDNESFVFDESSWHYLLSDVYLLPSYLVQAYNSESRLASVVRNILYKHTIYRNSENALSKRILGSRNDTIKSDTISFLVGNNQVSNEYDLSYILSESGGNNKLGLVTFGFIKDHDSVIINALYNSIVDLTLGSMRYLTTASVNALVDTTIANIQRATSYDSIFNYQLYFLIQLRSVASNFFQQIEVIYEIYFELTFHSSSGCFMYLQSLQCDVNTTKRSLATSLLRVILSTLINLISKSLFNGAYNGDKLPDLRAFFSDTILISYDELFTTLSTIRKNKITISASILAEIEKKHYDFSVSLMKNFNGNDISRTSYETVFSSSNFAISLIELGQILLDGRSLIAAEIKNYLKPSTSVFKSLKFFFDICLGLREDFFSDIVSQLMNCECRDLTYTSEYESVLSKVIHAHRAWLSRAYRKEDILHLQIELSDSVSALFSSCPYKFRLKFVVSNSILSLVLTDSLCADLYKMQSVLLAIYNARVWLCDSWMFLKRDHRIRDCPLIGHLYMKYCNLISNMSKAVNKLYRFIMEDCINVLYEKFVVFIQSEDWLFYYDLVSRLQKDVTNCLRNISLQAGDTLSAVRSFTPDFSIIDNLLSRIDAVCMLFGKVYRASQDCYHEYQQGDNSVIMKNIQLSPKYQDIKSSLTQEFNTTLSEYSKAISLFIQQYLQYKSK